MPQIKSSTDLRNNYNDISIFCHESAEPVFITKNGRGDLAVMSIDLYEDLVAQRELHELLDSGLRDISAGRTQPAGKVFAALRADLDNDTL
ncbi:MAG: type II toxin-antitoxin system Phd/YefM family antitoxin [Coriobacteriales bacterium]|jgi:prevent-host-death family protein|nr:type II toxin-antitoxin system Phd/YefM family antitoxin [Coriobacteriales bacterium]